MTGRRRDLDDLQAEIQELFADLWQVPRFAGLRRGFRPQCDCFRTDDPPVLHVVVELPGVEPATVGVAASGQVLVIGGTRERPTIPGARYRSMEIEYGSFERRVELGVDVDAALATARYDRGMLKIVLPIAQRETKQEPTPIEVTHG
jgi:HSP20 family molecular chaperone IbpA